MDKDLENLQALYVQKKMMLPSSSKHLKKAGEDHLKKLKDAHVRTVFTFIVTAAAIWYIDHVSAVKLATSVSGFWMLMGCALYYAARGLFLLRQLNHISPAQSALKVMEQLGSYKKLNSFLSTYGEIVYVVVLSIGVYLYIMPILSFMNYAIPLKYVHLLKLVWVIYIGWVLLHTFYFKRGRLKAETAIIENYLQSLKAGY